MDRNNRQINRWMYTQTEGCCDEEMWNGMINVAQNEMGEISYSTAKTSDVYKQKVVVQLVEEIRDCSWQWAVFLCMRRELTPYSLFIPELRVSCLLGLSRPAAAAKHRDHVFITSNLLAQEPQSATGIHTQLNDTINAWNLCVSNATFKNAFSAYLAFCLPSPAAGTKGLFWKLFKLYIPSILMY